MILLNPRETPTSSHVLLKYSFVIKIFPPLSDHLYVLDVNGLTGSINVQAALLHLELQKNKMFPIVCFDCLVNLVKSVCCFHCVLYEKILF